MMERNLLLFHLLPLLFSMDPKKLRDIQQREQLLREQRERDRESQSESPLTSPTSAAPKPKKRASLASQNRSKDPQSPQLPLAQKPEKQEEEEEKQEEEKQQLQQNGNEGAGNEEEQIELRIGQLSEGSAEEDSASAGVNGATKGRSPSAGPLLQEASSVVEPVVKGQEVEAKEIEVQAGKTSEGKEAEDQTAQQLVSGGHHKEHVEEEVLKPNLKVLEEDEQRKRGSFFFLFFLSFLVLSFVLNALCPSFVDCVKWKRSQRRRRMPLSGSCWTVPSGTNRRRRALRSSSPTWRRSTLTWPMRSPFSARRLTGSTVTHRTSTRPTGRRRRRTWRASGSMRGGHRTR